MWNVFIVLATLGFGVLLYAYWVELKIKSTPHFKPFCDINDKVSCTQVIKSDYSNMFFLPNAVWGMLFYAAVGLIAFFEMYTLLFLASIAGLIVTIFYAYLLFFKIKSACIVCITTYIINICFFVAAYAKFMDYYS